MLFELSTNKVLWKGLPIKFNFQILHSNRNIGIDLRLGLHVFILC